ncbi:MAG: hypothetical protein M1839_006057 [Geoglossum umbratile]|nr:MAG: hypothetical protein M1839_006057 [Geoglossum umbratile]
MASIQPGDIIQVSKVVWDLYKWGWSKELSAGRLPYIIISFVDSSRTQYIELRDAVRNLAQNLDNVSHVVSNAFSNLQAPPNRLAAPPWDFSSLWEIIGDYHSTINECKKLLLECQRYHQGGSALRNIEWNIFVQPTVKRLTEQILLHNSKTLFLLKPLEIDLLCRIHQDLASRIDAVHAAVLGQEIVSQSENQRSFTLAIPPELEAIIQQAAEVDHPELRDGNLFPLSEGAEAFVIHFNNATVGFRAGLLVDGRTPSAEQYLNLLKCIWIMRKLQHTQELSNLGQQSHWPSYIKQLDAELSQQCQRFTADHSDRIFVPELPALSVSNLSIWPQISVPDILPPIHHESEGMMDELMNIHLAKPSETITHTLRVLRGAKGKMRVFVSAIVRPNNGEQRTDSHRLDFTIQSASLIPLYAIPNGGQSALDVILRADSNAAQLTFAKARDLLKFQQALTGFQAYKYYHQVTAAVSLVITNQTTPQRFENACLQLWIPMELEGKPSTTCNRIDVASRSRQGSSASTAFSDPAGAGLNQQDSFFSSPDPFGSIGIGIGMNNFTPTLSSPYSSPTIPSPTSAALTGVTSSATSPRNNSFTTNAGLGINRSSTLPISNSYAPRSTTTFSISNSSSSSSGRQSMTVVHHGSGYGYMHRKPLKPMLVLFLKDRDAQSPHGSRFAFVTIQIDEDTAVNPERCDCGTRARSACSVSAIERDKGSKQLIAHRYETGDSADWDITALGTAIRSELPASRFENLRRVTIQFVSAEIRDIFGGTPCRCKLRTNGDLRNCILSRHQGLFGEVKQLGRRALQEWSEAQDNRNDVVMGQAPVLNG